MKPHSRILAAAIFIMIIGFSFASFAEPIAEPVISKFLRAEHDQIYATLDRLAQSPGKTGKAAKKLSIVMRPHLMKEEEFVLPQLSVLRELALGKNPENSMRIVERSEKLKEEFPQMVAEHKAILKAVEGLIRAAQLDGEQSAIGFASHLKAHIQDEDDIVYPAAILAGEYIKKTAAASR